MRLVISYPFAPYLRLFQRILDVSLADVRGMEYMARSAESGHQVNHRHGAVLHSD
jgi:hypothetical protein